MNTYLKNPGRVAALAGIIILYLCWVPRTFCQDSGNALELDGRGDYMVMVLPADIPFQGSLTFEAWIFPRTDGGTRSVLAAVDLAGKRDAAFSLSLDEKGHLVLASDGGETIHLTSRAVLSPRLWYHVAVVLRGEKKNRLEIWINGFPDETAQLDTKIEIAGPPTVGNPGDDGFNGLIDELRLYTRALTENDIEKGMTLGLSGGDSSLVAYYTFDGSPSSGKVMDRSSWSGNGILHGDAALVASQAPVYSSIGALDQAIDSLISEAEAKFDEEKVGTLRFSFNELLDEGRRAYDRRELEAACKYAWAAWIGFNEVRDRLQEYVKSRQRVHLQIGEMKGDRIPVPVIERNMENAGEALRKEDFDAALRLVSTAEADLETARQTYPLIQGLEKAVAEVEDLECESGKAKKKLREAVDAFSTAGWSRVGGLVDEGLDLAREADCGRVRITNLLAQAARYDGKNVMIKGKIKDLSTVYDGGHKIAVDDGTGMIWVVYQGAVKNLDYWKDLDYLDKVIIEGVFSETDAHIEATKVR